MSLYTTDWLELLINGKLDIPIPSVTLLQGNGSKFIGSGTATWLAGSRVRLSAVTDGGPSILARFGVMWPVGKLIPHDDFIELTGTTQDGAELKTYRVPMQGYSPTSGQVVWSFDTPGLTLTRTRARTNDSERREIRALVGPPPPDWPRYTQTVIDNQCFPGGSSVADWLVAPLSFGRLAARQRSPEWFELKIEANEVAPKPATLDLVGAAVNAFSFALGRKLSLRGFWEHTTQGTETRCLLASREETKQHELLKPLGGGMAFITGVEQLLGRATDFFLTKTGERVATYLNLCWDTADNDLTTRMAVAGSSLEGLLRVVSPNAKAGSGCSAADTDIVDQWLKENVGRLDPTCHARLTGLFKSMSARRPVDVLWDWEARHILGLTPQDIQAWERTRNPAAHGSLPMAGADREELQLVYSRSNRVLNLINRVILQLVGYKGIYRDYAQEGYPEVEFPAAEPAAL